LLTPLQCLGVSISIGVALPEDAAVAETLVTRTAALAQRLSGRWVAFIFSARNSMERANMAMRAGGTVFCYEAEDIAQALLEIGARERIDLLILGSPKPGGFLARFRPDTTDRVIRAERPFDVVVISNTI
jgi:K+-sensing histidine kinase KdpD